MGEFYCVYISLNLQQMLMIEYRWWVEVSRIQSWYPAIPTLVKIPWNSNVCRTYKFNEISHSWLHTLYIKKGDYSGWLSERWEFLQLIKEKDVREMQRSCVEKNKHSCCELSMLLTTSCVKKSWMVSRLVTSQQLPVKCGQVPQFSNCKQMNFENNQCTFEDFEPQMRITALIGAFISAQLRSWVENPVIMYLDFPPTGTVRQ